MQYWNIIFCPSSILVYKLKKDYSMVWLHFSTTKLSSLRGINSGLVITQVWSVVTMQTNEPYYWARRNWCLCSSVADLLCAGLLSPHLTLHPLVWVDIQRCIHVCDVNRARSKCLHRLLLRKLLQHARKHTHQSCHLNHLMPAGGVRERERGGMGGGGWVHSTSHTEDHQPTACW